jgi:hypothetical protein
MSRDSSRRMAIESRIDRIVWAEIAMRPMRSRSIAAIGASRTGARATSRPGSASRKSLTQATSRNSRKTCRIARAIPISSTPMIRPLRPGLDMKAE